jgi:hypothetical protein
VIPTRRADLRPLVALDAGAACTYLDHKSGREISITNGLTLSFINPDLQYQNGDFHDCLAVSSPVRAGARSVWCLISAMRVGASSTSVRDQLLIQPGRQLCWKISLSAVALQISF